MIHDTPQIGAEVFIEPGQSPEEIDTWFRVLHDTGLTTCRIRLFETYLHTPDGTWDFTLFDRAYAAAARNGIAVWGNLFPATAFTDVGGFKFPRSPEHLEQIRAYIQQVVTHFKSFPSCYGWVPINEPGSDQLPDDALTRQAFAAWKTRQPSPDYDSRGYIIWDFCSERFLLEYNTWYLQWLVEQIQTFHPGSPIHVNNHAIFENVAEYDFPAWRPLLASLGGSSHASWHFGYFTRDQYSVAMSANCEIIRSGAGDIPWLMTEIQGGNNTFSGFAPMCPTKAEISQWLWIVLGSGGQGGIFWCLNPRGSGFEAGEWALLDFQNEPSERLIAASEVAHALEEHLGFFAHAQPVESGISLLYTRESLWIEKALHINSLHYEGRDVGGVMKSVLSYFEVLGELGVNCRIQALDEYDFSRADYTGQTIILAHQICLPSRSWAALEHFVANGGTLLVDGLTGYYDEHAHCIMKSGFPLAHVFGGMIREFIMRDNLFDLALTDPALVLPAHCWQGTIKPTTATPTGTYGDHIAATRHFFGRGKVVWVPALIGLGGRIADYTPLTAWLMHELHGPLAAFPIRFKARQPGMLMKTLQSGDRYMTVLVDKGSTGRIVDLTTNTSCRPTVVFATQSGNISGHTVTISSEETLVIQWT